MARELSGGSGFSLLCGRYEGVDHRVHQHLCDGEVSIGDYVLGGGEAAALVVIEATARLLPGVMGNEASAAQESFGTERPARGAALHPPGRLPGLGGAARCCVPATMRASPAGAAPRPFTAPLRERPDLLEARGGLTEEEGVLLREVPPVA